MMSPEPAFTYLLSLTRESPRSFEACSSSNHTILDFFLVVQGPHKILKVGTYACRVGGWSLTQSTQIPLPLNGLRPTDGPIIRLLLAFQKSAAFARFNLSAVAEDTIATILSTLWAFWSDLNVIPVDSYPQFCSRLKQLMPSQRPDGGDVMEQMADFVRWVKDRVRAVSVTHLRATACVQNQRQCVRTYRPVDEVEIREAVEELYGYRQMSYVNIQADEGEGGLDSDTVLDMKAWVLIRRRVMGSERLFVHDYDKPRYWDIQSRYPDQSTADDSGDDEPAAARTTSTERSLVGQASTQTEDLLAEEVRLDPTSTEISRDYTTTACADIPDLSTSMENLSIERHSTARVHLDHIPVDAQAAGTQHATLELELREEVQKGNAPGLHSTEELAQAEAACREDAAAGAFTSAPDTPAIGSVLELASILNLTSIEDAHGKDAALEDLTAGAAMNAPSAYSTHEHARADGNAHGDGTPFADAAVGGLRYARASFGTHELPRIEGAGLGDSAMQDMEAGEHIEHTTPDLAPREDSQDAAEGSLTAYPTLEGAPIEGPLNVNMLVEHMRAGAHTNALTVQLAHERVHTGDEEMGDAAASGLTCAPPVDSSLELMSMEQAYTEDTERERERMQ